MQALRAELQRHRTSIFSVNQDSEMHQAVQDLSQIKELEDKLVRLELLAILYFAPCHFPG